MIFPNWSKTSFCWDLGLERPSWKKAPRRWCLVSFKVQCGLDSLHMALFFVFLQMLVFLRWMPHWMVPFSKICHSKSQNVRGAAMFHSSFIFVRTGMRCIWHVQEQLASLNSIDAHNLVSIPGEIRGELRHEPRKHTFCVRWLNDNQAN